MGIKNGTSPLKPNQLYSWEIILRGGKVVRQYNEDGSENTWKSVKPEDVYRFRLVPALVFMPVHEVICSKGVKFIRRFGRGFIKQGNDGFKLREYANCVVTNKFRFYVLSNGTAFVTDLDFEYRW